jgi:hypothetical protein
VAARIPPERVFKARELLAAYRSSSEAAAELVTLYKVDPRTARRYIHEGRKLMASEATVDRDSERVKVRAALQRIVRETMDAKHHRVALMALQALVELDGLSDEVQRFAVEHGFAADSPVLGKRALAERLAELEARAKAEERGGTSN